MSLMEPDQERTRELEASEFRLRQFIEQCPFAVAMLNREMRYLYASQKWMTDYRLHIADIRGKSHYEIFPDMPKHWREIHNRCLAGATEKNEEEAFLRSDGKIDWIRWEIRPWYESDGQIGGILIFSEDISHRKATEEALKQNEKRFRELADSLSQAVVARDEFMSIASHELKTPLTSLRLQAQLRRLLVTRGDLARFAPDKISRMVMEDEKQIDRITRLVDDMLDISRLKTGKLTIKKEQIDISQLTKEVVLRFYPQAEGAGCLLLLKAPEPVLAYCDPFRIEQVITNILSNALKYGARMPIEIEVHSSEQEARIIVRDQGIGIDEKNHRRIFQQFERAVSNHHISGLGLGLFISKQIMDAHGGTIEVQSKLGKGSSFILKLPHLHS